MQLKSLLRPVILNNGLPMPRIGIGTYLLQGKKCQEIVHRAVQLGYRHIDTAYSYENEKDIGEALKHIESHGTIGRKQLFITTKIARVYLNPVDVKLTAEESRENLKVNYLDMLLIHSPWGFKNHGDGNMKPVKKDGSNRYDFEAYDLSATWAAMEEQVKIGKVKSIGLSNFTEKQIKGILQHAKIVPQNLQFECHAYYQQRELRKFCDEKKICCTAYAPLGSPGLPVSWHPSQKGKHSSLLKDETVLEIAENYERTPAQILLRLLLEQNLVVIPKTSSPKRLEENFSVFDFELEPRDVQKLNDLDRGLRYFLFELYKKHPYFPSPGEPF